MTIREIRGSLKEHIVNDRFCSHCGSELTPKMAGGRERAACPKCGRTMFGRFSLGVGGLVEHAGRVLFVQRGENPGRGRWTIPGGYVEEDETPDQAVVREVFEETSLRTRAVSLLAIRNTLRGDDQNAYYVFKLDLEALPEIAVDGRETVDAKFFAPEEFDSLADLAPMSRWIAEHHSGDGLKLIDANGKLKPLAGSKWALFGIEE